MVKQNPFLVIFSGIISMIWIKIVSIRRLNGNDGFIGKVKPFGLASYARINQYKAGPSQEI